MGLFDKVKSNLDNTLEKGKELSKDLSEKNETRNTKQREKKELKEQAKINKSLEKHNIFEGIKVKAFFPEKEIVIKSHSGLTKGVATLTFGLAGLGATSGVKQEKQRKTIETIFQVVEKGIVFKNATDDGKDLRIPYDNIVRVYKQTTGLMRVNNKLYIKLLENQEIVLLINASLKHNENIRDYLVQLLDERATGIENEEAGWGLESSNNESSTVDETSSTDELEKIMDMYQKGLLTDEEFAAMKKKIIEQ